LVEGLVPRIGDVERYEAVGAAFAGRLGCVSARIGDVGNLWAGSFSKERIVGGIGNNGTGDDPVQQKIKYDRVPRKNQDTVRGTLHTPSPCTLPLGFFGQYPFVFD
jgi:hypothetical protein